jgi:phosphoglycerate dehydrogenase-like enzyme
MNIAILDDYQSVAADMADWSQLPPGSDLKFFHDHIADEGRLVERLKEYHVVMGMRERTPFPRSVLERLPELRLLITAGMGNVVFDLKTATELGIVVSGTDSVGEAPTELTWGLIIALMRHIPHEDQMTRQGHWGTTIGVGLQGRTLGLLGLGHIGSRVARVGKAFDMNIIAWSQNLTAQRARECGATLIDKDALFQDSDIVSVHVRLSDRTRGPVGAREIGLMKPTAYLINISRGPIVDEGALIDALRNKSIAGAGIDTFDVEPLPPHHPILELPNTVLTSHIGYLAEDGYRVRYSGVVEDIRAFVSGEPIRVLNPEVLGSAQMRGPV